jgi:hypothetical protein
MRDQRRSSFALPSLLQLVYFVTRIALELSAVKAEWKINMDEGIAPAHFLLFALSHQ